MTVQIGKASVEDVVTDGSALQLAGYTAGCRRLNDVAEDVAVGNDTAFAITFVLSGNTGGSGILHAVAHLAADHTVLNDTIIDGSDTANVHTLSPDVGVDNQMTHGTTRVHVLKETVFTTVSDAVSVSVEIAIDVDGTIPFGA